MPETLEIPGLKFEDESQLADDSGFPTSVILIALGGGRYAAVNATTPGPDPMTVGLLATFADETQVTLWQEAWGLTGDLETMEFERAREIALSKPSIYGLGLQVQGQTAHIHWVR